MIGTNVQFSYTAAERKIWEGGRERKREREREREREKKKRSSR